jgi:Beta-lactamase superfamily domain
MATSLDWYGCATFVLRTASLTVFLDAYIDRAPGAAGTGLTADDVDRCDWIVVGHSHFDHLYGAERIARNTGARIVGSHETVRIMEQAGVPAERMICVASGETVALSDDVRVSAYPSQHSCVWSQLPGAVLVAQQPILRQECDSLRHAPSPRCSSPRSRAASCSAGALVIRPRCGCSAVRWPTPSRPHWRPGG